MFKFRFFFLEITLLVVTNKLLFLDPSCVLSEQFTPDYMQDKLKGMCHLYLQLSCSHDKRRAFKERAKYYMSETNIPFFVAACRIFSGGRPQMRQDMFDSMRLPLIDIAPQTNSNSCGMFCLSFVDSII